MDESHTAPEGKPQTPAKRQRGSGQERTGPAALRSAGVLDRQALIEASVAQPQDLQPHQTELTSQLEELQRANAELQQLRDQYRDLYEQAPIGYLTLLEGGVIQNVNHTGAQQLGQPPERLKGRRLSAFLEESSRTSFAVFLRQTFEKGQAARVELCVTQPGEEVLHVQMDALVYGNGARGKSFVRAAMTDITALKVAQETIMELNSVLEQRVDARTVQLRELNSELETFVQTVTQDLRAPLRRAVTDAEALQQELGAVQPPEHLGAVVSSVRQMDTLLLALSNYFRVGRQRARFVPVSLESVLADVRRELRPREAQGALHWRQEPLPTVTGDARYLHLIFKELLDNALKFSAPQSEIRIEVLSRKTATEYHIGVRDNGVGFNMRQKDRLFGMFQRLHSPQEFAGLGTGLATVRRAVLRHGGRVWAESKEGQGSCFWVAFPRTFSSLL